MSRIPTSRDRRPSRFATAVLALGCAALVTAPGVPAAAAPAGAGADGAGCQTVHAGPEQGAAAARRSYFQFTLRPGQVRRASVVVANPEPYACSVTLEAASGETAANSGDTYPVPAAGCVETSCWLGGLPATLRVPAGGRVRVRFVVTVPSATDGGEYLAGVVVRPTDPPARPSAAPGKEVAVAVTSRVALGVAVVVPGAMRPGLTIPAVRLDVGGPVPMLYVTVRNVGNTWEHPVGGAVISTGTTHRRFGVRASTVLAGDSAELPLPAAGISRGTWPTTIELNYGHGQSATWRGQLSYPKPPPAPANPQSPTGEARVAGHVPHWVFLIIGGLGLLVVVLAAALFVAFARRRGRETAEPGAKAAASDAAELADASPT